MYSDKQDPKLNDPYSIAALGDNFASIRKPGSKGMNTLDPAQDIDELEMANTRNTIISAGVFEPREGSSLLLAKPSGETGTPQTMIEGRGSDGTNFLIVSYGANFYLYDAGAIPGTNSQWVKINGAYTPTDYGLTWGWANWNAGFGTDRTYFNDGRNHMYKWQHGLSYSVGAITAADTTITVTDGSRFPAAGFLIVQDYAGTPHVIEYTSKAGNVFTLIGATGFTALAGATITMRMADVSSTFIGKIMFTWQRRLLLFNRYGVETGVYYSDVGDPEGFAGGGVDGGGAFQFSDGNGPITSGQDFGDYALIGKENGWSRFDFIINLDLNAKLVRVQPFINGQSSGPTVHQGCVKTLNQLSYPTPTEGMLRITPRQSGESSGTDLEILSAKINNLWTQTFSIVNARSKYFDQKVLTAVGVPSIGYNDTPQNKNVPNSLIAVYDVLRDGYTIWDNLPVADFAIHNSLLYYLNNATGAIYQLFPRGIYADDDNAYSVTIQGKERDMGNAALPKTNNKVYVEGFLERNTLLYVDVLFNHLGVLTSQTYIIDGSQDYVQFGTIYPMGSFADGVYPLGAGGLGDAEMLGIFRVYLDTGERFGFYTLQLQYRTSQVGAQFKITGEGFNPMVQLQAPIERVISPSTT